MRIVDILNCVPTLPLLLIASMVIESWQIDPQMQIYYLMMIMTLFGWAGTARMVRGQILYLREQEYIVACEVMGIPVWRRILKHLIPNIMPQLIVSMTRSRQHHFVRIYFKLSRIRHTDAVCGVGNDDFGIYRPRNYGVLSQFVDTRRFAYRNCRFGFQLCRRRVARRNGPQSKEVIP